MADQIVHAWRTGIYATIRRHCRGGSRADDTVSFLKPILEVSRVLPTLLLFHTIWHYTFSALRSRGEHACAKALDDCYFKPTRVPAQEAHDLWGLESWPGDTQWVYCAAWWSGLQHIQPGTASGSQAQEAWHRNTLKMFMCHLRRTMPEFIERLEAFCQVQLEQLQPVDRKLVDGVAHIQELQRSDRKLADYPGEPWPDHMLLDSDKLARQRRTSAEEYVAPGMHSKWQSDDGTWYFAMRQHTFVWDTQQKIWTKNPSATTVPDNLARLLAAAYEARSQADLEAALHSLGLPPLSESCVSEAVRFFEDRALVIFGKSALSLWRRPASVDPQSLFPHACAVCAFCLESALHCTCEHAYAAFLMLQDGHPNLPLDDRPFSFPKRQCRLSAPPRHADTADDQVKKVDERSDEVVNDEAAVCDPPLFKVLRALGIAQLAIDFLRVPDTLQIQGYCCKVIIQLSAIAVNTCIQ